LAPAKHAGCSRSDEELLAYYVSFLKTVSMKLNERTVQFFFHTHRETPSFPLYCEAIKLFRHPESMVRAAIRTLTLNVFAVPGRQLPAPYSKLFEPNVHPTLVGISTTRAPQQRREDGVNRARIGERGAPAWQQRGALTSTPGSWRGSLGWRANVPPGTPQPRGMLPAFVRQLN
jgi:hypothetical protein